MTVANDLPKLKRKRSDELAIDRFAPASFFLRRV